MSELQRRAAMRGIWFGLNPAIDFLEHWKQDAIIGDLKALRSLIGDGFDVAVAPYDGCDLVTEEDRWK